LQRALISCLTPSLGDAYVILVQLQPYFALRLRHCNSEGLQGYASFYTVYPIAEMPHGGWEGIYLATLLAVSLVECLRDYNGGGFRGGLSIYTTHLMVDMPHSDSSGFYLAVLLAVSRIIAC
jgi:hypothetical protein